MIWLIALAALAQDTPVPEPGGQAAEGVRLWGAGGDTAVRIGHQAVLGRDGGTHATTILGRLRMDDVQLAVALPFSTYRTPGRRDHDLGNVQLQGAVALPYGGLDQHLGLRLHFDAGDPTWTWASSATDLWPGAGIEAFWEARATGTRTWMMRAAFGVHATPGFAPFPARFARFQVAAGLDQPVSDRLGIVAETAIQYWDPSPWEIAALGRVDLLDGLRARAGLVLPVAVWAGWTPAGGPPGVRETSLVFDLTLSP